MLAFGSRAVMTRTQTTSKGVIARGKRQPLSYR